MTYVNIPEVKVPRVVIIGCGFGGLQLAKALRKADVQVVMMDKNNYHTFQPLLYQVASAGLEADSIAYPIRKIFVQQKNFHFRWGEVLRIHAAEKKLETSIGVLNYDYLVIATGSTTNFFGNADLEKNAMGMKSVTESLNLRSLILQNLEGALLTRDLRELEGLLNFVIVGGGPTGVELAGALSELKKHVLPNDYPELDLRKMRVILIESGAELLQAMQVTNQQKAQQYLHELGAEVWLNTRVTKYDGECVQLGDGKQLLSRNLIWAAGVKGVLIDGLQPASMERGKILVDEFNRVKGEETIFAIGDVAAMITEESPRGHAGVAPVAMQQGQLLAKNLERIIRQETLVTFRYFDKGTMATVGRNRAVVEAFGLKFGGLLGWLGWMFLHLMLLVGFRNRIITFINWMWNYISYDRHIRLIIRPYVKGER